MPGCEGNLVTSSNTHDRELYAQVKKIFHAVVDLPSNERNEYLNQHCAGRDDVRSEVETLLLHHDPATIVVDSGSVVTHIVDHRVEQDDALAHLSPSFVAELLELLRVRLVGLASLLLAAMVVSLLVTLISPAFRVQWNQIGVIPALLACLICLRGRWSLSLVQMRCLEAVIMTTVCVLLTTGDVYEMMRASDERNIPDLVGASTWSFMRWSVLILVYGLFVPNAGKRAAMILFPVAIVPYAIRYAVRWGDPLVDAVLTEWAYDRPLPMPFFAAAAAVYASHLFFTNRIATYRARHFAQYRLGRLLGKGGMGEVYEARHNLLKRSCAIKLIRPDREFKETVLSQFEREVQATAKLSHPNTIEIFDFGQTIDGIFYYVMELLPGMDLMALVSRHGPLPFSRICYLCEQICGALAEAHERGLIHRDIKPGNLFVCERGGQYDVAKVLDFGLVLNREDVKSDGHRVRGTPAFMAPEQGLRDGHVDARTDIYALGATVYYMATGRSPFEGRSPQEQLIAHASESVRPPSEIRQDIPEDLEKLILRCLEKDPAARYQDMAELSQAFHQCDCRGDWDGRQAARWWAQLEGQAAEN